MMKLKVGIFLSVGLIVLTISIFMLGSNKSLFQKSVKVATYFDSVQGLNAGAIVSFAGVKAGNIDKLEFDSQKNLVRVDFVIDQIIAPKIKNDSVIEIRTQGALGDKYLYITPGLNGESIANGTELKSDYGSDIISVISKRGNESEKIFDIISNLQKITDGLAKQNKLPSVINKLDVAADNLGQSTKKLNEAFASGKLKTSVDKLDHILEKVDNGQGTLGALINDRTLHERLKSLLGAGQKQQQVRSIIKSSIE